METRRLIDAQTLYDELSTLSVVVTGLRAGKGVLNDYMKEYRKSVLRVIDEQPTVDAVEVVRCKGCKHYVWDEFDGCYVCVALGRFVMPDFWCAYGERKDNG